MGLEFMIYSHTISVTVKPHILVLLGIILKPIEDN